MQVTVKAIGVNRADVFYRQGKYPFFGLELSGIAQNGKRVAAIVNGGAYAETVEVQEECIIEIPDSMSFEEAAAITESLFTAYHNLVSLCKIKAGENVLIHGGASGVGVVAIQLAKLLGANVSATAGKKEKLELIEKLGANAIDYNTKDFGKEKFDVILDIVGASYFDANLAALKRGGRLAIISFIGGAKTEVNLAPLLLKSLQVFGSTITGLSAQERAKLRDDIKPYFVQIKPVIDKVFPISEKDKALDYVEKYGNVGKVVVAV